MGRRWGSTGGSGEAATSLRGEELREIVQFWELGGGKKQ